MASPNILTTDNIEQGRVKINDHFNDTAEHGGGGGGPVTLNTQTGANYNLVLADAEKIVLMDNAGANTLTVPQNSSVAFPVGTTIGVVRYGAGTTTIQGGTGTTVRNSAALRAQYSVGSLIKVATNEWILSGDTA